MNTKFFIFYFYRKIKDRADEPNIQYSEHYLVNYDEETDITSVFYGDKSVLSHFVSKKIKTVRRKVKVQK